MKPVFKSLLAAATLAVVATGLAEGVCFFSLLDLLNDLPAIVLS